jgi:hypothetical protein
LLGAWLSGRALEPLLRFPPLQAIPEDYPRFSWLAAGLVLGAGLLLVWPWVCRRVGRTGAAPGGARGSAGQQSARPQRPGPDRTQVLPSSSDLRSPPSSLRPSTFDFRLFPWWGWLAILWTLLWWWLAWTRLPWFAWAQHYTFTPLWLGFIATVNALACRRGRTCLLQRAPWKWLALFAASAAFWWVFEWLNRFVNNWHYLGAQGGGAAEYALHASLCFSTVLPAVAGVRELLGSRRRLQSWLSQGPRWSWLSRREAGVIMVAIGAAGLLLTGAQPVYFYPTLWAAPLLLGVGLAVLGRREGWWREVAAGDWRDAGSWALAALVCGFFWELWNLHSLAKWAYTVPFVQRWQVFEMPLLGYTGYLTFGLECALATAWILGEMPTDTDGRG